jgi:LmbE family N-acetylglucosaminyl deacetylase
MSNKVLVIAVHPDDETLGCGGTLIKHKTNGDEIHWLVCTDIDSSNSYYETRVNEIKQVQNQYAFTSVENLNIPTMKVDEFSMSALIQKISPIINKIQPNIIYLPFKGDVHSDHRKIFEATYSCTKSFRYPFIKKIYMMETLSETEFAPSTAVDSFIPNHFVDISDYLDKKLETMQIYKSELADHPFPRSLENIKALATLRGASCNCHYAESFVLLKSIE